MINTWIETYEHEFKNNQDSAGAGFTLIKLRRFDYHGKPINGIKIRNKDREKFKEFIAEFEQPSSHFRRRVEIELDEKKVFNMTNDSCLKIGEGGIKSIKKWEMPQEVRFQQIGFKDSRDGIFRIRVKEKGLVENSLTPKINLVGIELGSDEKDKKIAGYEMYLHNAEDRGKDFIIKNIDWEPLFRGTGEEVKLVNGELILKGGKQKNRLEVVNGSGKYPHPEDKKDISWQTARERVSNAVDKACQFILNGKRQLFKWGYINSNKEDFREAVQSMSDLIKISKHGSEEEKEWFVTNYPAWQDYQHSHFDDLRTIIKYTAEVQKWKYDLEKGEVDWGSASQNNQDQDNKNDNVNDEKRKSDDDNSREGTKRARVEIGKVVKQDIDKKDEEVSNKLTNALQGLLSEKTNEEKENSLADIEKSKNEGKISEDQKSKITEKKDELAKSDPVGYGKMFAKVIQQKIKEFKVEIAKLGQEVGAKIKKLQNGEFTSDTEVRQIEEEVSEKVSEEVANIELNDLLTKAQKILNSAASNLKSQLEKAKKDLYSLKLSTNHYQQRAYEQQKPKVEKVLKDLESYSTQTVAAKDNFPLVPIIIIPSFVLLSIGLVIVIRNRRIRKQK